MSREFYFTAIKFKNEDEAIALRWKYDKKLPNGKSTENVRSIMHIFGTGENAKIIGYNIVTPLEKCIERRKDQILEGVMKNIYSRFHYIEKNNTLFDDVRDFSGI